MLLLTFEPFSPEVADVVATWATTADEVAAWCSRSTAPVPPEVIVGWSQRDDVGAHLLLAAGQPIAYGELWIDDEEREVELAHLIVDPLHRNQGLGRTLVAHLVTAARRHHPAVFLRLVPGNTAAMSCYQAAGFVRVHPDQERQWNRNQPHPYLWMTHRPQ